MWVEINRFKGALRLVEESSGEESQAKAVAAFEAADQSRKGRLSLDEFLVRCRCRCRVLVVAVVVVAAVAAVVVVREQGRARVAAVSAFILLLTRDFVDWLADCGGVQHAWVMTVDVQEELTKRHVPCMQIA